MFWRNAWQGVNRIEALLIGLAIPVLVFAGFAIVRTSMRAAPQIAAKPEIVCCNDGQEQTFFCVPQKTSQGPGAVCVRVPDSNVRPISNPFRRWLQQPR